MRAASFKYIFALLLCGIGLTASAQDTVRLMSYNVMNFGSDPACQAPRDKYHRYLDRIVSYAKPDIIGLIQVGAPLQSENPLATAPAAFADSIVHHALHDKYAYAPVLNRAMADNVSMLFYNKQKFGFAAIVSSYANISDFTTYKLYYKEPGLDKKDTLFLYVTLNNFLAGADNVSIRGTQAIEVLNRLKNHFKSFPNMVTMGDMNTGSSTEMAYGIQILTGDTALRSYDPPFLPDGRIRYPANWVEDPEKYSAFLTKSTRESIYPNSCGARGGATEWTNHIAISHSIMYDRDRISYLPYTYNTIGNDKTRYKISVNDSMAKYNSSVPADVKDAIFQMSDEYPVMIKLLIRPGTGGKVAELPAEVYAQEKVTLPETIKGNEMKLGFSFGLSGQHIRMKCYNADQKLVMKEDFDVEGFEKTLPCKLPPGYYLVRFSSPHNIISQQYFSKQ